MKFYTTILKKLILISLISLVYLNAKGLSKESPIDSLTQYVYDSLIFTAPDKSLIYCDYIINESKTQKDFLNIGKGYHFKGKSFTQKREYDSAALNFSLALPYFNYDNDKKELARINYSIARNYYFTNKFDSAFYYFQQSIDLAQKTNDMKVLGNSISSLGLVAFEDRNYSDAIYYLLKGLETYEQNNIVNARKGHVYYCLAIIYHEIGNKQRVRNYLDLAIQSFNIFPEDLNIMSATYNFYANVLAEDNKVDSSFLYLDLAFDLAIKAENDFGIAKSYLNKFNIFLKINELDSAKKQADKFNELAEKKINSDWVGDGFYMYAQYFNAMNKPKLALNECEKLQTFLDKYPRFNSLHKENCEKCFYESYKKIGGYDKSFFHFKNYKNLRDSAQKLLQINEIAIYENESKYKRETETLKLKTENKINEIDVQHKLLILCFLIFVSLIMGYLIYRNNLTLNTKNRELIKVIDSNNDLEKYAIGIAQDFKSPLGSISLLNELNKEVIKRYENSFIDENIELISVSTKQLITKVENILEISLIDSDVDEYEEFKTSEVIETVLFSLNQQIKAKVAKVYFSNIPKKLYYNRIDFERLFQNLISNSIRYANKEVTPIIEIQSKVENGNWLFSVKDNGIGIDEKYFTDIFKEAKRFSSNVVEGSGYGLFIVKKIIEKHKGKVWVESKLGKGSTFFFTIDKRNHS